VPAVMLPYRAARLAAKRCRPPSRSTRSSRPQLAIRAADAVLPAHSGLGHEDALLRPRPRARCRFSQKTFVRTRGEVRDAPTPVLRPTTAGRLKSTLS
jgi:hypothetical protein